MTPRTQIQLVVVVQTVGCHHKLAQSQTKDDENPCPPLTLLLLSVVVVLRFPGWPSRSFAGTASRGVLPVG